MLCLLGAICAALLAVGPGLPVTAEGTEALRSELFDEEQRVSVNLLQASYSVVNAGKEHGDAKVPGAALPAAAGAGGPQRRDDHLSLAGMKMLNTDTQGTESPASNVTSLVVILGLIAIGLVAAFSIYVGKAPTLLDGLVWCCCFGVVMVTGIGMWGPIEGGGMPIANWFAWHPVLMVTAFMCLMVLGRWAYASESPLGAKADRRRLHRALMVLAALVMIVGYIAIFKAHLPAQKWFGYYFQTREWAPWQRVVHVYTGYTTILLTLSQAAMGLVKYEQLKEGEKVFTFHGTLGKAIICMAGFAVIMGTWAQAWGSGISVLIGALTAGCVMFGALWPTPAMD